MTEDSHSHEQPDPPFEKADGGLISEARLDEMIARAVKLAADLSEELGADQEPPLFDHVPLDPNPPGLDEQLGTVERLARHANYDLSGDDNDPQQLEDPAPGRRAAGKHVPDFMADLTASSMNEGPVTHPRGTPKGRLGPVLGPKPGVIRTGIVTPGKNLPPPATSDAGKNEPAAPAALPAKPGVKIKIGAVARQRTSSGEHFLGGIDRIVEWVVRFLEFADRPFRGLGESVRRVIGLMAIGTLGAAVIVFVYSLV